MLETAKQLHQALLEIYGPQGIDRLEVAADFCGKLFGPSGFFWFQALGRVLRLEEPWQPVWKVAEIGTHPNREALIDALGSAGCKISDWARCVVDKTEVAGHPQGLKLALIAPAEIGMSRRTCGNLWGPDVMTAIGKSGYRLCPAEVALQLGLQYPDQPEGERLTVLMPLFAAGSRWRFVLCVSNYGRRGRVIDTLNMCDSIPRDSKFVVLHPTERWGRTS